MRKILTLAMFVGTVGTLLAQTPASTSMPDVGLITYGQIETMPAQPADTRATVRMSGGVVIVLKDGTRVTADQGTTTADGHTVELSGNVRLTFPKPTP
jgi:hypothetical protein